MSKETGGYAFPIPNADFQTFQPQTVDEYKRIQSGMTLRDYFAAKAMHAIITGTSDRFSLGDDHPETNMTIAKVAYIVADAMVEARGQ